MRYSQYRFKFYLNASHAIYIHGVIGDKHPHTWEIKIDTIKQQGEFIKFEEVENSVDKFLEQYQNKFLNNFEPFDSINPTLENITDYFLKRMQEVLNPYGWYVFSIEISETPTRSYIISLVENNIVSDLRRKNLAKDIIERSFPSN